MSLVVSSKALQRMLCSTSNEVRFGSTLNFLTGKEELFLFSFVAKDNFVKTLQDNSKLFESTFLAGFFYIFFSSSDLHMKRIPLTASYHISDRQQILAEASTSSECQRKHK
jgi:hypothetical protein